jgi:DNA-binding NarL/FixJ family response regulator
MDRNTYDVVVTDLSMPIKNGHALAVEILALQNRPAIVILSGIAEPRIEEDLRRRGVEAIVYKPVNLQLFAKCVHKLAVQRQELLTPELNSDIPASFDFLSVNPQEAAENKYQQQKDFWKTPSAGATGEMTYSSFHRDKLATPHFQNTDRQHETHPMQTSQERHGVLVSPSGVKEGVQDKEPPAISQQPYQLVRNPIPLPPFELVDAYTTPHALETPLLNRLLQRSKSRNNNAIRGSTRIWH